MRLGLGAALPLILALLATSAQADRSAGLERAWADPAAVRSVYFVEGMSCRACTMILDVHLNREKGVYWARFNYPLRLLTAYHDPRVVAAEALGAYVGRSKELRAVLVETRPAGAFRPGEEAPVASWRGGALSAADAREGLSTFLPVLEREFGGEPSEERTQVVYEILGELARSRILQAEAARQGFPPAPGEEELPLALAKDFYWPKELLPLSPEEAAVARLVRQRVVGDGDGERERLDRWLSGLWKEVGLDFRGELGER